MGNSLLRPVGIEYLQAIDPGYEFVAHFFECAGGFLCHNGDRGLVSVNPGTYEIVG